MSVTTNGLGDALKTGATITPSGTPDDIRTAAFRAWAAAFAGYFKDNVTGFTAGHIVTWTADGLPGGDGGPPGGSGGDASTLQGHAASYFATAGAAPTAHAGSHAAGQPDAVTPAAIGAATSAQGDKADAAVQPITGTHTDEIATFTAAGKPQASGTKVADLAPAATALTSAAVIPAGQFPVSVAGTRDLVGAPILIPDTFANRPASGAFTGQRFIATDGGPEWIWTGAAWQPWCQGLFLGTQPPAYAGLTWVNQGGYTAADSAGGLRMQGAAASATGSRMLVRAVAGVTTVECWPLVWTSSTGTTSSYPSAGVVLRESGTGKTVQFVIYDPTDAGKNPVVSLAYWSAPGTRTSFQDSSSVAHPNGIVLLRLVMSGSTWTGYISRDGVQWTQIAQLTAVTLTPNQAGVVMNDGFTVAVATNYGRWWHYKDA